MPFLGTYWGEYARHAVLNFGQAMQGFRYFYSHPDVDARHRRGSAAHVLTSMGIRLPRAVNDLVFCLLPPRWHHSPEQMVAMMPVPVLDWFQYGYCAWKFTGTAEAPVDLARVDRRWDPRCKTKP